MPAIDPAPGARRCRHAGPGSPRAGSRDGGPARIDWSGTSACCSGRSIASGSAPVASIGSGAVGHRGAHGAPGDADARPDRTCRGRGQRGRTAAPPPRANQQRHRPEVHPKPRAKPGQNPGQNPGPPRNPGTSSHASAGISDSSTTGQAPVRGSSSAANPTRSRLADDYAMPPGTLVPPPPERLSGAGTLTPPGVPAALRPGLPPGPAQPLPDGTNVAIAGTLGPSLRGRVTRAVPLPSNTTRRSGC